MSQIKKGDIVKVLAVTPIVGLSSNFEAIKDRILVVDSVSHFRDEPVYLLWNTRVNAWAWLYNHQLKVLYESD